MAVSLRARLSVLIVKWRVKRRLKGVRDYRVARQILRPDPYKVPPTVQISPAHLGGVPGERLEGPAPGDTVLLYLHGGGYFGCSAETHRPITAYYALHGFHVFAADYRSEERRVGKECRYRWVPYQYKKIVVRQV